MRIVIDVSSYVSVIENFNLMIFSNTALAAANLNIDGCIHGIVTLTE